MQLGFIFSLVWTAVTLAMATPQAPAVNPQSLQVSRDLLNNSALPFIPHHHPGPFGKAVAMNINYEAVKSLRLQLEKKLGYPLKKFTVWNPEGEAHITTITPPEYTNVFSSYVSIDEMDDIARANEIQMADLQLEGLGRGTQLLNNKIEETYFIIVRSAKLLKIRQDIYRLYISRGGNPKAWNPEHFYPHITVGFTLRDLHESDGVIKDKARSLDTRFQLELEKR